MTRFLFAYYATRRHMTTAATMGMERIHFGWYLKRISGLALLGYFAGAGVYIAQRL